MKWRRLLLSILFIPWNNKIWQSEETLLQFHYSKLDQNPFCGRNRLIFTLTIDTVGLLPRSLSSKGSVRYVLFKQPQINDQITKALSLKLIKSYRMTTFQISPGLDSNKSISESFTSSNLMTWKGCENSIQVFYSAVVNFFYYFSLLHKRTKSSKTFSFLSFLKVKWVTNEEHDKKSKSFATEERSISSTSFN